jgi:hypothetical protein
MAMHFDLVDLRLMVHIADANSMTRGAAWWPAGALP